MNSKLFGSPTADFLNAEDYERERIILDWLHKKQDDKVKRLFRHLVREGHKEAAREVERIFTAYYPSAKLI